MNRLTLALAALVTLGLTAGDAFAFSCPRLVKDANDAIAKAEPMAMKASEGKDKARAEGLITVAKELAQEAEALHNGGKHGESEAKAKAAKYLAEQVK